MDKKDGYKILRERYKRTQMQVYENLEGMNNWEAFVPQAVKDLDIGVGSCVYIPPRRRYGEPEQMTLPRFDIELYCYGNDTEPSEVEQEKLLAKLRDIGFIAKDLTFNRWGGNFYQDHILTTGDVEVKVSINGIENSNCTVEQYTDTVQRYRARCKETKETVFE